MLDSSSLRIPVVITALRSDLPSRTDAPGPGGSRAQAYKGWGRGFESLPLPNVIEITWLFTFDVSLPLGSPLSPAGLEECVPRVDRRKTHLSAHGKLVGQCSWERTQPSPARTADGGEERSGSGAASV